MQSHTPQSGSRSGAGAPIVTVSVQFPELSEPEFARLREGLVAAHPERLVLAHQSHRWYSASSDPETVAALVTALRALTEGRPLSFDDEEALDDLVQEYGDWLEESAETDDDEHGTVMSFSVHLPALDVDEFAAVLADVRADHPRRIVLGEQRGHSHHEVSDANLIASRMPGLRAALRGEPVTGPEALPLVALLGDYAAWLCAARSVDR